MLKMAMPVQDVIDACKDAGRQLIENGIISQDTLSIIGRELLPRDMYVQMINQYFRDLIEKKS